MEHLKEVTRLPIDDVTTSEMAQMHKINMKAYRTIPRLMLENDLTLHTELNHSRKYICEHKKSPQNLAQSLSARVSLLNF
jgi:hypothetical protein